MCLIATPSAHSHHQQAGTEQVGTGALLRGRTGLECPEGNLRELTWDSTPNCGIARERERERTILWNALTWGIARPAHRTKDRETTRGDLVGMDRPIPHQKQTGKGQPELERGNCGSREAFSMKLQTGSVANQELLSFWTVDIRRESCNQRSAPQKSQTRHTWEGAPVVQPENQAARTGQVIRHSPQLGETALSKHLVTWAARVGEGYKTQAKPSLGLWGVHENLNLSGLDL